MNGFIEVTEKFQKRKITLPVFEIRSLGCCEDGNAFIETGFDNEGDSIGVYTQEPYEKVKQLYAKAILFFKMNLV